MRMQIYDTHAHFEDNREKTDATLKRAREAGVTRLMAVGGSDEINRAALLAHSLSPNDVRIALGYERDQFAHPDAHAFTALRAALVENKCAALGEIGLDFHYDPDTVKEQCDLFGRELALADELNLPVVIHTREADDATLGVLDDVPFHGSGLRGIIHCYTGNPAFARRLLDRGFMISISGIVTFRAADNVRESALYVPNDRLLIETDSPFLAPVPKRGTENEPAFIVHTAHFLAELRKMPVETLTALTFANAVSLLG